MLRRGLWLTLLAACKADPTADGDTDPDDTDWVDTDFADTDATDTADTDAADTDVADTDAASFKPDPRCDYLDLDLYVVFCGGVRSSMRGWAPTDGDPTCPTFFSIDGDPWLDASDALTHGGCDDTCVYSNDQAVMLLYCDVRGEYITYAPNGPGQIGDGSTCDPLIEVHTVAGDAWVPDMDTYRSMFPCPP